MGRKLDFTRYDLVVHLQSAAVGSAEHYAQDDIRLETAERAAELDAATLEAWSEHPRLVVVQSVPDFEAKMKHLEAVVRAVLPPQPGFAMSKKEA